MPDSMQVIIMDKVGYDVSSNIGYEVVELLQYDGDDCENDKNYKFDECLMEYIQKVVNHIEPIHVVNVSLNVSFNDDHQMLKYQP